MSIDVTGLTSTMLPIASSIFNALVPVIGLTSGISLAVGLAGKIMQAVKSAF